MNNPTLLIFWVLSQQASIMALFGNQPLSRRVLLFFTAHLIASACLSLVLTTALPRLVHVRKRACFGLFMSFSFFIPVLGGLGMLAAFIYFRFFQKFDERAEFTSVPMSPFMNEAGAPAPGMGEGGAWSRLRAAHLPRPLRLKALLAASSAGGQNASRLLQMATSDSDDEIRLLAFNLADRREKVVGAAISTSLAALRSARDDSERSGLCRKLAFSYWEMIFNDLATRDLALFFADQALHYARQALELNRRDAGLLVLAGRLHLWLGDAATAERSITSALECGAHRDRVIPYLAEIAFRQRDYATLRRYLATTPLLRHKPGIGPVVKFWMD